MSVRKNQRNENRFTVLDAALDLYDHTASIVCNPKYDKCRGLADRIEYESAMIYHYCRSANEDYDNRVQEQAKIRLKLQYDAIEQCKWLKTDIRLAQRKLHLRANQVCFWNDLVNTVMSLIRSWTATEKRNYKEKYGL